MGHFASLWTPLYIDRAGSTERSWNKLVSQRGIGSSFSCSVYISTKKIFEKAHATIPAIEASLVRSQSSTIGFTRHYMTQCGEVAVGENLFSKRRAKFWRLHRMC
jgi:hypothetical protein